MITTGPAIRRRRGLPEPIVQAPKDPKGGHRLCPPHSAAAPRPPVDLIDQDKALRRLEQIDDRLCRVAEMKFFAGYTTEETAEALGSSARTVKRDWRKARALLYRDLGGSGEETSG